MTDDYDTRMAAWENTGQEGPVRVYQLSVSGSRQYIVNMNADNLPDRKSPLCPISTAMRRYVLSSTPGLDEGEPPFFSTRREKEKQYSFQFLLPSILLYGTPDEVNSSCRSSGRDIIVPRNGGKLSTVHTILRQRERKFPDAQNRGALEYLAKRRETETASERNSSSLPTEFAIIASEKSCGRESSSIVVVFVLDVADYQLYGVILIQVYIGTWERLKQR